MTEQKGTFTPPHSMDAEKAVLGAVLRSPENLNLIVDRVKKDHFFLDAHGHIFVAMTELYQANQPPDLVTVSDRLRRGEAQSEYLSAAYLVELMENAPVAQNIEHYTTILRDYYYLRRIIGACQTTVRKAINFDGSVGSFVEDIEKEFLTITNDQDRQGLSPAVDILESTLSELEERLSQDGSLTGVTSGFHGIDRITGGWQKSDLIIIAARPGMGKTSFALNCCMHAVKNSTPIALFSLEMAQTQLMMRLMSAEANVDGSKLRRGDLTDDEQSRLMYGARQIGTLPAMLGIDETPGLNIVELRSRCRRFKKEHGLGLVVVDYLQLMTSGGSGKKYESREREISEISAGLKGLAKELSVPVIALAQLNRGPDTRTDKIPKLSDLRESGSMEQDADMILFIYRDEMYNPNSEDAGKATIRFGKNRHGSTGDVDLAFTPHLMRFSNLQVD